MSEPVPVPAAASADDLLLAIHDRYRVLQRLPERERPRAGMWHLASPRYLALLTEIRTLSAQYVALTKNASGRV